MRSVYLALSLCLVASCGGDPNDVGKDKHELLKEAYELNLEKWHALGLVDYQFDLSYTYYCDESGRDAITYIVEAGKPIHVNDYTVEDVFILAAEKIELPAYQLEVEYDEVYGVPLKIKHNDSLSIADDERCLVISSFQPIAFWKMSAGDIESISSTIISHSGTPIPACSMAYQSEIATEGFADFDKYVNVRIRILRRIGNDSWRKSA